MHPALKNLEILTFVSHVYLSLLIKVREPFDDGLIFSSKSLGYLSSFIYIQY